MCRYKLEVFFNAMHCINLHLRYVTCLLNMLLFMQIPSSPASPTLRSSGEQMASCNHDTVFILVTQRHLMEAAVNMRPSVSPAERFKYQQMYV